RTSNSVVFPAPLWPIRPTIVAGWTVRLTSSSARRPPNRLVMPRASSVTPRVGRSHGGGTASGAAATVRPRPSPMNTARRMSGRSSRPAVGPRNRTWPFSRKIARWQSSRATLTGCSTTTTVVPWAWISRTFSTRRSTTVGARPSDSSSMHSSFGFHEGHGQGQLLLLAAGQVARQLVLALAEDREHGDGLVDAVLDRLPVVAHHP